MVDGQAEKLVLQTRKEYALRKLLQAVQGSITHGKSREHRQALAVAWCEYEAAVSAQHNAPHEPRQENL